MGARERKGKRERERGKAEERESERDRQSKKEGESERQREREGKSNIEHPTRSSSRIFFFLFGVRDGKRARGSVCGERRGRGEGVVCVFF